MKPLAIAITGGIASGKSTAARVFARLGDRVLDADDLARKAYGLPEVQVALAARLGWAQANKAPDFAVLRAAIRADSSLLAWLEELVHPPVVAMFEQALAGCGEKCLVGVIPLLFETGLERLFDKVIALSIDATTQRRRVIARQGMDDDWLKLILARQMEQEERNCRADIVLPGDLALDELDRRLMQLRSQWLAAG